MKKIDYICGAIIGGLCLIAVILADAQAMDVQQIVQQQATNIFNLIGAHVIFSTVATMAMVRLIRKHWEFEGRDALYLTLECAIVIGALTTFFTVDTATAKQILGGSVMTAIASPLSYDLLRWFTRKTERVS